ncbi:MAG: ABC transporter permease [Thermoplasmata archaeon]|jgi:ABC-2 type transport system permease protein|nr:ABC transporter permease [Thermoplasmata archaeon]
MMANDFKQIAVVTKNEIIKMLRGKKFLISLSIILIIFALITILKTVSDGGWDNIQKTSDILNLYLSMFSYVILLVVALLSSVALVSEFEERTALILFTRPIKRTTILIGKAMACLIVEACMILAYYILVCIVSLIQVGGISEHMAASYGIALLYIFAASGISFIVSSFFKRGSVCTIISLLVLIVIIPIFTSIVGGDTWYMLDTAGNTIITCVPEYVDGINEGREGFVGVVSYASMILNAFTNPDTNQALADVLYNFSQTSEYQSLDKQVQDSILYIIGFLTQHPDENLPAMIETLDALKLYISPMDYPDVPKEALVLMVWGIIGYLIAWVKFIKREF